MSRFDNIDCMIGMAEYEANHFDLAMVDPPYGIRKTALTRCLIVNWRGLLLIVL